MANWRDEGWVRPKLKYRIKKPRKKVLYSCQHCGNKHKSPNGHLYCEANPEAQLNRERQAEFGRYGYHEMGGKEAALTALAAIADKERIRKSKFLKHKHSLKRENPWNKSQKGEKSACYGKPLSAHRTLAREMGRLRWLNSKETLQKSVVKHDVITPFMPSSFDDRFFRNRKPLRDEFEIGEISERIFSGDFDGF